MVKPITALGIMSGTSLDGLDLALCSFSNENERWTYTIIKATTIPYQEDWLNILQKLPGSDALTLAMVNASYGRWIGKACNQFLKDQPLKPLLVASHGHTVFHRPAEGMTLQIGSGAAIAAETGLTTVCDFRSLDVSLGGHGAPLVPIGDKLLFGHFDACVNIGGFANLSYNSGNRRVAWDICPANFLLNREAARIGLKMDESGKIAREGMLDESLLQELNSLDYYLQKGPKSLGREWVEQHMLPIIEKNGSDSATILRTVTEHIAFQVSKALPEKPGGVALFTGGGAHNHFLMERISQQSRLKTVIPDNETIDFKEALIFAFLGVLRITNQPNCLAEVTGASRDNCGGAIYQP